MIWTLFKIPLSTELPGPPTNLAISNIGPRSVALQFKPGYDGKTSISRWQVEAQVRHFVSLFKIIRAIRFCSLTF